MNLKYQQLIDLSQIYDSMEIPVGVYVASLEVDNNLYVVKVKGEVEVTYKGETYYDVDDFPQALKELFHSGNAYYNSDVEVESSNWFECFQYVRTDNGWEYTGESVVLEEFDNSSPASNMEILYGYHESFKE